MKVSAELVIVDALLKANQRVIQLGVELVTLLQKHLQVVSNQYCLVDLLEELTLGGVVAHRVNKLLDGGRVLLDNHSDLLLLLLKSLILAEVLRVLRLISLEHLALLQRTLVYLHELLDGIELILHRHAVVHYLFLALSDLFQRSQLLFDDLHGGVLVDLARLGGTGDHGSELLACLAKQCEALLVGLKLGLELGVRGHRHIHLLLVLCQTVLILLVDSRGRWSVEFRTVLGAVSAIFRLLVIKRLLALGQHVCIDLLQALASLDTLREVLCGALLLELLYLGPDLVGHVTV